MIAVEVELVFREPRGVLVCCGVAPGEPAEVEGGAQGSVLAVFGGW